MCLVSPIYARCMGRAVGSIRGLRRVKGAITGVQLLGRARAGSKPPGSRHRQRLTHRMFHDKGHNHPCIAQTQSDTQRRRRLQSSGGSSRSKPSEGKPVARYFAKSVVWPPTLRKGISNRGTVYFLGLGRKRSYVMRRGNDGFPEGPAFEKTGERSTASANTFFAGHGGFPNGGDPSELWDLEDHEGRMRTSLCASISLLCLAAFYLRSVRYLLPGGDAEGKDQNRLMQRRIAGRGGVSNWGVRLSLYTSRSRLINHSLLEAKSRWGDVSP
ncbi:hypothetical protein R1flu_010230 [Riccia fluitans]|uniref:Ribosomal protein L2 n=1 Tax=Riccia fluitans TaxID=41844 RepID=A0ABD1Z4D8_9MARC